LIITLLLQTIRHTVGIFISDVTKSQTVCYTIKRANFVA